MSCDHALQGKFTAVLKDIVIDSDFFGVSAVSRDGYASPVEFPGAAGSFVTAMPEPGHDAAPRRH